MDITKAFIESYLNIRKTSWKLDISNNENGLQYLSENTIYKISVCQQALIAISNATSHDGWIAAVNLLYDLQIKEEKKQSDRFFFVRAVTNEPLVAQVLHAIRSYIISELEKEEQFHANLSSNSNHLNVLTKEIEAQENVEDTVKLVENQKLLRKTEINISAMNCNSHYYIDFFNSKIKKLDKEASTLKENTFEDFMQHVLDNSRPSTLSDWVRDVSFDNKPNETKTVSSLQNNDELNPSILPTQEIISSSQGNKLTPDKTIAEEHNERKNSLKLFNHKKKYASRNHTQTKRFIDEYEKIYQKPTTR